MWEFLSATGSFFVLLKDWVVFSVTNPGWALAIGLGVVVLVLWLGKKLLTAPLALAWRGLKAGVRRIPGMARGATAAARARAPRARQLVAANPKRSFIVGAAILGILIIGGIYWSLSDTKPKATMFESIKQTIGALLTPGTGSPGSGGTTSGTPGTGSAPAVQWWKNLFKADLLDPQKYKEAEEYAQNWNRGYWASQTIPVNRKVDGSWQFIYRLAEPPTPLPIPWTGVMPFAKATLKVTKAMNPFTGDLNIPIVGMTNYPEDGKVKPGTVFYTPVMRGIQLLELAADGKIEVVIEEVLIPVEAHRALESIKDEGENNAGTLWNFLKEEKKEWFDKDPLGKNKKP